MCSACSVGEAVADEEIDVLPDPLGPESGFGEACGHCEEIDDAAVARSEDGCKFGVGNVDAREGDIDIAPARGLAHGKADSHRIACIGGDDRVAQPQRSQLVGRPRAGLESHDAGPRSTPRRRASATHKMPLLPPAPRTRTASFGFTSLATSRRRPRDIQRGQRQPLGHILRELGVGAARKEDRLTLDIHLRADATNHLHMIDAQRREGERHECGHPIADLKRLSGSPGSKLDDAPRGASPRTQLPGCAVFLGRTIVRRTMCATAASRSPDAPKS